MYRVQGIMLRRLCTQESVMGSRAAVQALVPGRVVLLTDAASGLPELAAICGAPPGNHSRGIQLGSASASAGVDPKATALNPKH